MIRKQLIRCRVCLKEKSRDEMRKTSRGRTIRHCRGCRGLFRCNKCGEVKEAKHFKTHSGNRQFFFDDGDEQRIAVCYVCDSRQYAGSRSKYLRSLRSSKTILNIVRCSIQNWKLKCKRRGWDFDVSLDYLVSLWNEQDGRCFYTGEELSLNRGKSQWNSASLDRMDSSRGYVKGNVVWTSRLVNSSKGQRNVDEFVGFCRKVVSHIDGKTV